MSKSTHSGVSPQELLRQARLKAPDGKLYNQRYHNILLVITTFVPVIVLIMTIVLGGLATLVIQKNAQLVGLAIVGAIVVWLMHASSATKGAPTYITAATFALAVSIYAWTGIFLLALLVIFALAVYMLMQRRARFYGTRWVLNDAENRLQRFSEVPWYFGDTENPWVTISLLEAATPKDSWWEKLFRLRCGTLTIKTQMQEGDDAFLKDMRFIKEHEVLSSLIAALITERDQMRGTRRPS